jgi:hypothetical protein
MNTKTLGNMPHASSHKLFGTTALLAACGLQLDANNEN